MGQICPLLSTNIKTFFPGLENNDKLKFQSDNFPRTLANVVMLDNLQNNISMCSCSQIQYLKVHTIHVIHVNQALVEESVLIKNESHFGNMRTSSGKKSFFNEVQFQQKIKHNIIK